MNPTDRLREWALRASRLHANLNGLVADFNALGSPPTTGVPLHDAADLLLSVWKTWGLGDPGRDADIAGDAKRQAEHLLNAAHDSVPRACAKTAGELDAALSRACSAESMKHPEIVRAADFQRLLRYVPDAADEKNVYILGPLSGRTSAHPLRTALPPDDYFASSEGPALVLGRGSNAWPGSIEARAWYSTQSVLELTREWRRRKRQIENERRAQEENDRPRARKGTRWHSLGTRWHGLLFLAILAPLGLLLLLVSLAAKPALNSGG